MSTVWLDGRFLPEERAFIPATDRAVLHGRGLFETLRAYRGMPFRTRDHVERMAVSARRFGIPFDPPDAEPVIRELCLRNRLGDAAVRLTLTAEGRLLITARRRRPVPAAWYRRGARVRIASWRRDPRAPLAGHKVTSYFENVLAHEEALREGCADLIYVGLHEEILEGAVSNLFLALGGRLVTPRLGGILPGVTRQIVMGLARVQERTVRLGELEKAEEAFLTNALLEVLPVGKPGPIGLGIARGYRELTRQLR